MGIDVELTGGPAVEIGLDAVTAAIHRHDRHGWVSLHRGRVVVSTLLRYYDESYERGHWPTIRALVVELRALVPQLRYGGDHAIPHEDVTDAMLARLDTLWSSRAERCAHGGLVDPWSRVEECERCGTRPNACSGCGVLVEMPPSVDVSGVVCALCLPPSLQS